MMPFRKFHVKKDERALLFYKGDFVDILRPGEHLRFDPLRRLTIEKFGVGAPRFEHRLAEFLLKAEPALVAREFHVVELGPAEVGLRYENGVLAEVLAPNARRLYFKGYLEHKGIWSDAWDSELRESIATEISDAQRAAEQVGPPAPDTLFDDVYSDQPWHLQEQKQILLDEIAAAGGQRRLGSH